MSCKTCNPLCFEPVNDQCITYTGPDNVTMDIDTEDSLAITLTKLINFTQKLYDQLNKCNPCAQQSTVTTSSSDISGSSQVVATLPLTLTSTPKDTSVDVTYSVPALPAGHELISSTFSVDGTKNGYKSRLSESTNLVGGFTLQPNNFPVILTADVKTISVDGEHSFKFSSDVSPVSTDYKLDVPYIRNTDTKITDQSSINTLLNTKINSLDQKFTAANSITTPSVPGSSTPETVVYTVNQVQSLNNQLQTLTTQVNDLAKKII